MIDLADIGGTRCRAASVGRSMERKPTIGGDRVDAHRRERHRQPRRRSRNIGQHNIRGARWPIVRCANVVIQRFVEADWIILRWIGFSLGHRQIKRRRKHRVIKDEEVVARIGVGAAIGITGGRCHRGAIGLGNRQAGHGFCTERILWQHDHVDLAHFGADKLAHVARNRTGPHNHGTGCTRLGRGRRADDLKARRIDHIDHLDIVRRVRAIVAHADDIS